MQPFWITFDDGTRGCCEGQSEYDAKRIAAHVKGKPVAKVEHIPYPAKPLIWQFDHPIHGKCPDFCFTPQECVGRTACPRPRACND